MTGGGIPHELLGRIAHELRNPLGAILGWAHILKRREGDEENRRGLEVIEQSVLAQTRLIDNLMELSRLGSGQARLERKPVEPRTVIDAAIESVQGEADFKSIRIAKVLDLAAGPVAGDPARLKQALVNLLGNAVKFTPDEGAIEVVLRRVEGQAEISVTDSGHGFVPAEAARIFDHFEERMAGAEKRRHGGVGLGLEVARRIVRAHGGELLAASAGEGRGATFSMRLPLAR